MGGTSGVFPIQSIRSLVAEGIVSAGKYTIPAHSYQPASLDLRLGEKAYRLRSSFLPDQLRVQEKLSEYSMEEVDLRDGAILERNRPYLIPLLEGLRLPPDVRGRANPRSSTGRLDIFTRVVTDRGFQFDEVPPGYYGPLYLEVFSRTFTIRVQTELALNQLRFMRGSGVALADSEIVTTHNEEPLLFREGQPVGTTDLRTSGGLFLSLDLQREGSVGFRAKRNSQLLDLGKSHHYEWEDFWEPVRSERGKRLVLEPEEFYLLISVEAVRVLPDLAADMVAYDPTSGELRTHYAGFFDPGFGWSESGRVKGSKAVLEVRAHDVPFAIEHGQPLAKLAFLRMTERPIELYGASIGSHFQAQDLNLSRQFKPVPPRQQHLPLVPEEPILLRDSSPGVEETA